MRLEIFPHATAHERPRDHARELIKVQKRVWVQQPAGSLSRRRGSSQKHFFPPREHNIDALRTSYHLRCVSVDVWVCKEDEAYLSSEYTYRKARRLYIYALHYMLVGRAGQLRRRGIIIKKLSPNEFKGTRAKENEYDARLKKKKKTTMVIYTLKKKRNRNKSSSYYQQQRELIHQTCTFCKIVFMYFSGDCSTS